MSQIDTYLESLTNNQYEIMYMLHHWLTSDLGLEAKYRFKIPFYYGKTWICYLNPIKKDGVEFCFVRARELSYHEGLLDFKKRKMVAGISFFDVKQINLHILMPILEEAILLDDTVPYTFKKK